MKILTVTFLLVFNYGCVTKQNQPGKEYTLRNYQKKAEELLEVIKATEILPGTTYSSSLNSSIRDLSFELIDVGSGIANRFIAKNADCRASIQEVTSVKNELGKISSPDILEKKFYQQKGPKTPEKCYDVRDLILQPAIVIVLTNKDIDRPAFLKMQKEIDEAYKRTERIRL